MNSIYGIKLDGETIGETSLETGDPPMGVVCGKVLFSISENPYTFFKSYCHSKGITINQDEEELGFIDTQNIIGLKVFRSDGIEIAGEPGASICGFSDEGYDITILGVPHPFYGEEFPHLCKEYDKQFFDSDAD